MITPEILSKASIFIQIDDYEDGMELKNWIAKCGYDASNTLMYPRDNYIDWPKIAWKIGKKNAYIGNKNWKIISDKNCIIINWKELKKLIE